MTAREFREQRGIGPDGGQDRIGGRTRFGPRGQVAAGSRDQDVGCLVEIAGAEALPVLLVEPQTCSLVRLGRDDLALNQDPHCRLFCGFAASFRVAQRLGLDAETLRFLQQ